MPDSRQAFERLHVSGDAATVVVDQLFTQRFDIPSFSGSEPDDMDDPLDFVYRQRHHLGRRGRAREQLGCDLIDFLVGCLRAQYSRDQQRKGIAMFE